MYVDQSSDGGISISVNASTKILPKINRGGFQIINQTAKDMHFAFGRDATTSDPILAAGKSYAMAGETIPWDAIYVLWQGDGGDAAVVLHRFQWGRTFAAS